MASEYDALLESTPAQQKSEYDALLPSAQPKSSVLGEIGTAIKNTAVGFVKGLARPPSLAEIALPIFGGQIERQYEHAKAAEQAIRSGQPAAPSIAQAYAPNVSELASPEATRGQKIQAGVNIAAEVAPFLVPALRGIGKYGVAGRSLSDIAFGAPPKSLAAETAAAEQIQKGGEISATQERVVQEGNIPKYPRDDTGRASTETGGRGGNAPSPQAEAQAPQVAPAVPQPEQATQFAPYANQVLANVKYVDKPEARLAQDAAGLYNRKLKEINLPSESPHNPYATEFVKAHEQAHAIWDGLQNVTAAEMMRSDPEAFAAFKETSSGKSQIIRHKIKGEGVNDPSRFDWIEAVPDLYAEMKVKGIRNPALENWLEKAVPETNKPLPVSEGGAGIQPPISKEIKGKTPTASATVTTGTGEAIRDRFNRYVSEYKPEQGENPENSHYYAKLDAFRRIAEDHGIDWNSVKDTAWDIARWGGPKSSFEDLLKSPMAQLGELPPKPKPAYDYYNYNPEPSVPTVEDVAARAKGMFQAQFKNKYPDKRLNSKFANEQWNKVKDKAHEFAKEELDKRYASDKAKYESKEQVRNTENANRLAEWQRRVNAIENANSFKKLLTSNEVTPAPVPKAEGVSQPTETTTAAPMSVDEAVSKFAKTGVKAIEPPVQGKVFRVMSQDEWNHVSKGGENYSGGFWSSDPSEYSGHLGEGDILAVAPTQGPVQYRGLPKKHLIEAGRQHYNNLERRDLSQITEAYRMENGKLVKILGEPTPQTPTVTEPTTAAPVTETGSGRPVSKPNYFPTIEEENKVVKDFLSQHDASQGSVPAKNIDESKRNVTLAEQIQHQPGKSKIIGGSYKSAQQHIDIGRAYGYSDNDIAAFLKHNYPRYLSETPYTGTQPVEPAPPVSEAQPATTAQPLPKTVEPPPPETPEELGQALKEPGRTAGVANRILQERAVKGEIPQAPAAGEGHLTEDIINKSRAEYSPERALVAAQNVRNGSLSEADAGQVRIHEEALTKAAANAERALDADPKNPGLKQAYETAKAALTQWHNDTVQPMKTTWSNAGKSMQGETDIDTGSYIGLQKLAWDTAKRDFTAKEEPVMKLAAKRVSKLTDDVRSAISKAEDQVQKVLKPSKYMDLNQLRESLAETLKSITC